MAARATGSGTISFGLVSIPVKFYTATSKHQLSFNMLHKKCGTRVRQQLYCPVDDEVISRADTVKGYEHAKDQFVQLGEEELKKLESERSDRIDIVEFVPESAVDPVYVESTQYLGPSKGGERAYRLLADAMQRTKRFAIGRYGARGRDQLVLLRPYKDGLAMHPVYYADEVRSMEDVELPRNVTFRPQEAELADKLVEQLSTETFDPGKYHDEYGERVMAAVQQKVTGQEITAAPEQPQAQIIDLFEALKRSLTEKGPKGPAKAAPRQEAPAEEEAPESARAPMEARPLKKTAARRTAKKSAAG